MAWDRIGGRIAEARQLQGLTQRELAEKVGVRERTVARWEAGQWLPNRNALADLARALDVSVAWLFTETNNGDEEKVVA